MPEQLASRAYVARFEIIPVSVAQRRVPLTKPFRQKSFDVKLEQLGARVAEHTLQFRIHQHDAAVHQGERKPVGREFEHLGHHVVHDFARQPGGRHQ